MKPQKDKRKEQATELVEKGTKILKQSQNLRNSMVADDVAHVTMWVTQLGGLVRELYGDKSPQYASYVKATETSNFYSLHSNWNTHIGQLLGVANSIIYDLEHDIVPKRPSNTGVTSLTDEQGAWWFFDHCSTKTRRWLIVSLSALIVAVGSAAYLAGRNHFITQVIDLWRKSSKL